MWLTQFDPGEINDEEAEASLTAEYEAQIAALERKVGQLTMELDLIKKPTSAPNLGDAELVAIIEEIRDELSCYEYRRETRELNRRGHLVNHKRVARVVRANQLGIKPRKWYVRTTDSRHDHTSTRSCTAT
ncbi:hypothetical protein FHS25_006798 [Rhizobium laguerreae]|uniref:HTH-like domain-containing protein n=1 Tax=Rhizobium laguerreae TaxID=1076926 RepID=A0ABR6GJ06_9HYPH|nr:IS3 family transposase [Rhizobium laguerreae]MBB3166281.1 hypothetical protein [Rhizobium laguerreae]